MGWVRFYIQRTVALAAVLLVTARCGGYNSSDLQGSWLVTEISSEAHNVGGQRKAFQEVPEASASVWTFDSQSFSATRGEGMPSTNGATLGEDPGGGMPIPRTQAPQGLPQDPTAMPQQGVPDPTQMPTPRVRGGEVADYGNPQAPQYPDPRYQPASPNGQELPQMPYGNPQPLGQSFQVDGQELKIEGSESFTITTLSSEEMELSQDVNHNGVYLTVTRRFKRIADGLADRIHRTRGDDGIPSDGVPTGPGVGGGPQFRGQDPRLQGQGQPQWQPDSVPQGQGRPQQIPQQGQPGTVLPLPQGNPGLPQGNYPQGVPQNPQIGGQPIGPEDARSIFGNGQ